MQSIGRSQPRIPIRPLRELITEAGTPLRLEAAKIVDGLQAERIGVGAPHDDGKGVVESERRQHAQTHAAVRVAQRRERGVRFLDDRLLQDRGERGAGVFDVGVDVTGANGAVADERSAEIEAPGDGEPVPLPAPRAPLAAGLVKGAARPTSADRRQ